MGNASSIDLVNSWAGNITRGRIPKVLSELSPDSEVLITNALYLKEAWTIMFRGADSHQFSIEEDQQTQKEIKVNMMERYGTDAAYGRFG